MAEMPDAVVSVEHDEIAKPHIVLPGKYALHEKLDDYEITWTFQTLEEMYEHYPKWREMKERERAAKKT